MTHASAAIPPAHAIPSGLVHAHTGGLHPATMHPKTYTSLAYKRGPSTRNPQAPAQRKRAYDPAAKPWRAAYLGEGAFAVEEGRGRIA